MTLTRPLSDHHRSVCPQCGANVWVYPLPFGDQIALDNAPGEYLIDGRNKAYRSMLPAGYRAHSCDRQARAPLATEVTGDEFVWP
jgi:hypothetical protein